MRVKVPCLVVVACILLCGSGLADQITFTFVDFTNSVVSASITGLAYGRVANVLVTDNTTGVNVPLPANASGFTGKASSFIIGPPLLAGYTAATPGAQSVLIAAGGTTFLAGDMEAGGTLASSYPMGVGAFLSNFKVTFLDPAILADLGIKGMVDPEGSVSLTLAQADFSGGALLATLGGGQVTIQVATAPVPELATWLLLGTATIIMMAYTKREEA